MAKRACLSIEQVIATIDDTNDSEDDDCEFDADEPVMEGSDEEFGEFEMKRRVVKIFLQFCQLNGQRIWYVCKFHPFPHLLAPP